MDRFEAFDIIDGIEVPQLVLRDDTLIDQVHNGTVIVESGTLILRGTIRGTLSVSPGATAIIYGKQSGSVSVSAGAVVILHGKISGSVSLSRDSNLIIEEGGVLAGSLSNNGMLILRGVFGGASSGKGSLVVEGNGLVKTPEIRDGIHYYTWD